MESLERARQSVRDGCLGEAISILNAYLREHPQDRDARILLVDCLSLTGEHERASRQLHVLEPKDTQEILGAQVYDQLLSVEQRRAGVFKGLHTPSFLSDPPPYAETHLAAIRLIQDGRTGDARALLQESLRARASLPGRVDGRSFADISDADDLLGPFMEIAIHDRYFWVPFDQLVCVEWEPPRSLRDLMWLDVRMELRDGRTLGGVTYPMYPGTSEHPEDRIRLGRGTAWQDVGSGLYRGMGLKMLLADEDDLVFVEASRLDLGEKG